MAKTHIADDIYNEMQQIRRRYGMPPTAIYCTCECGRALMKESAPMGESLWGIDPNKERVMVFGIPLYPILLRGSSKRFRVVICLDEGED